MSDRDGKRMFITGKAGSGKSHYAKKMIMGLNRVIVFDPEDEYGSLKGFIRHEKLDDVLSVLKDCWQGNFKIAFVPPVGIEQKALDSLSKILEAMQSGYMDDKKQEKINLVVDELNLSFPLNWKPDLDGFARICSRGRKRGINVIAISQRPAEVATRFRGNLDRVICFGHSLANDWQAIAAIMGDEAVERAKALPKYGAVDWTVDGINEIKP